MVHGDCSSRGCYSMTDEQISEIYALGREAFFGGQRAFQVQAYPFRMTPENLAKHRNSPHMAFWKMLKRGNDHFETTRLEPKVNVCEKRYVFDAENPNDPTKPLSFSAAGKCPAYSVADEVVAAVQDKQRSDEVKAAQLASRGIAAAPVRTNADGGMHPVFVAAVKRNEVGVAPTAYSTASLPGTIPATVRPPRIPELSDSPLVTGQPIAPAAGGSHGVDGAPMRAATPAAQPVRVASAEPAEAPVTTASSSSSGNFFTNMFSGSKKSDEGVVDRAAKLIGLKSDTSKPAPAAKPKAEPKVAVARPAAPKPAPAASNGATSSNGAIRPQPAQAEQPARTAQTQQAQQPAAPASNGAIAGAAPVVPAGNFDNRWSAFR